MKIEIRPLASITQYARNPRRNQSAVATVKASLKEYGWQQPIVVDAEGVIIAGHTRYLAALELGWTDAPVQVAEGLTPAQVKAYRIMDNRSHERAEWDMDLLALEMEDLKELEIGLELTGFGDEDLAGIFDNDNKAPQADNVNNYSRKIEPPIYTPKGDKPDESELFDITKTTQLISEINRANLPDEISAFLKHAAHRHTQFRFDRIAEYYCHSSADVQDLMERSALIIIDFNKSIEYGFVKLSEKLLELAGIEYGDD